MIRAITNSILSVSRSIASPSKSIKVAGVLLIATYFFIKARNPALQWASHYGWKKLTRALIFAKANVNSHSFVLHESPLHSAAYKGHCSMVKLLIKANANPSLGGGWCYYRGYSFNTPPIMYALNGSCDLETIKILHQYTPIKPVHLAFAITKGSIEVVDWILTECSFSLDQRAYCEIALHWACKIGQEAVVRLLVEKYKTDINTPLSEMIVNEVYDENLLPRDHPIVNYAPIHIAAWKGKVDIINYLVTSGAQIDLKTEYGDSIVHLACSCQQKEVLEYLAPYFETGKLNINEMNNKGRTPLYNLVSRNSCIRILPYFLDHFKPEIDLANAENTTPLHVSAYNGIDKVVYNLLSHGASIKVKDNNGRSAIHYAAMGSPGDNRRDLVSVLVQAGADINEKDNLGRTPLHYAVSGLFADPRIIDYLLAHKADIDAKDVNGRTPYHLACIFSHESSKKLLEQRKSNTNLKDNFGVTPSEYYHRPKLEVETIYPDLEYLHRSLLW